MNEKPDPGVGMGVITVLAVLTLLTVAIWTADAFPTAERCLLQAIVVGLCGWALADLVGRLPR